MSKLHQAFDLNIRKVARDSVKNKDFVGRVFQEVTEMLIKKLKEKGYEVSESLGNHNNIPTSFIISKEISLKDPLKTSKIFESDFEMIAKEVGLPWFTPGKAYIDVT